MTHEQSNIGRLGPTIAYQIAVDVVQAKRLDLTIISADQVFDEQYGIKRAW